MNRRELLTGGGAALLLGSKAAAQYQHQGRALVQRIAELQATDGAILMPGSGPERFCNPHAANEAVYGVLLGAPPRSRADAGRIGKGWITWYTAHLNSNGTIDDHSGTPGALKPI